MAKAATPIRTMLLLIRTVPTNRSRICSRRITTAARGSPAFSRVRMRAREASVKAVSAAAQIADIRSDRTTIRPATQSSAKRQ